MSSSAVSFPSDRDHRDLFRVRGPSREEGTVLLELEGELDIAGTEELEARLLAAEAFDAPLVLDLAGLTFIDSTGLAALVRSYARRLEVDGPGWHVRAVGHRVMRVFQIAGLDWLFNVRAAP